MDSNQNMPETQDKTTSIDSFQQLLNLMQIIRSNQASVKEFDLLDEQVFQFINMQQNQSIDSQTNSCSDLTMMIDNRIAVSSAILTKEFVLCVQINVAMIQKLFRQSDSANPMLWQRQDKGDSGKHWYDMYHQGIQQIENQQNQGTVKPDLVISFISTVEEWTDDQIQKAKQLVDQYDQSKRLKKEYMILIKYIEYLSKNGHIDHLNKFTKWYSGQIDTQDPSFWDHCVHVLLIRLLMSPKSMLIPPHLNLFQDIVLMSVCCNSKQDTQKELVQQDTQVQRLQYYLRYLGLICLKHRKCASSWHARFKFLKVWAWLIKTKKSDIKGDFTKIDNYVSEVLQDEIRFCSKCNKYEERNYYNWWYRMQLTNLKTDCSIFKELCNDADIKQILLLDSKLITEWLKIRPKDPSAIWYQQQQQQNQSEYQ